MFKHSLFFDAVEKWLANPRKYEVTRDIGESLAVTEYADDLNLYGDHEDTFFEDEPMEEDLDFIDDMSLLESSSAEIDPGMGGLCAPVITAPSLDSDDAGSSACTSHSTGTSGSELVVNEDVITENEDEAQETDAGTHSTDSAETADTMMVSSSV